MSGPRAAAVRVRLLGPGAAAASLQVAAGERVLDALDEQPGLGLPTACRAANCGACLLQVVAGAEALQPPLQRERATLQQLGAGPDQRLGCQICIRMELGSESEAVVLLPRAFTR